MCDPANGPALSLLALRALRRAADIRRDPFAWFGRAPEEEPEGSRLRSACEVCRDPDQIGRRPASSLHGAARVDLLHDAVTSFDVAARWGLAVCVAAVLLSAAGAAIGLSGVPQAKR
jgi:hypothetical protein